MISSLANYHTIYYDLNCLLVSENKRYMDPSYTARNFGEYIPQSEVSKNLHDKGRQQVRDIVLYY